MVNPAGIELTYGYDAAGQRAWMAQPTGRFTYSFDPVGRISTLVNPESQTTSWSYDAASTVITQLLANGVTVSNTYDAADRLLILANLAAGGTTLSSFNYTYNSAGNRTQVVESNGDVVTWSYDPTYQLTNEQRSGANAYNITYVYDPVGNRTLLLNGGAATTSTYNAANELATSQSNAGTTTFSFDGSGNLLTSQAPGNQWTTNSWDGEGRLTRVALPAGVVDSFTYNGDGQRVQKQDSTGTTNHVWDEQNIILETNASNIIQVVYTLEPLIYGNLISQSRSGVDSFYLFDALGSARQLAPSAGSLTDTYVYDSFGNILAVTGSTTNPFRYSGKSGYYHNTQTNEYSVRARFYNQAAGVFLSRDPVLPGWAMLQPPYLYSTNNPVTLHDPAGLSACNADFCGPKVDFWFFNDVMPKVDAFASAHLFYAPEFSNLFASLDFLDEKAGIKTAHCPSPRCEPSAQLCGVCIIASELGNIAFGWAAQHGRQPGGYTWVDGVTVMLFGGYLAQVKNRRGFDKISEIMSALAGANAADARNPCAILASPLNISWYDEQGLIAGLKTLNGVYLRLSPSISGRVWNILKDWDAIYGASLGSWRDALKTAIARLRKQSALDANKVAGCAPCDEVPNLQSLIIKPNGDVTWVPWK